MLHGRELRVRWQSSLSVARYVVPFGHALLAGVTTLGVLELVRVGWYSIAHGDPFGITVCLVATGLAAALGFAWRTYGLDVRLGRRIG